MFNVDADKTQCDCSRKYLIASSCNLCLRRDSHQPCCPCCAVVIIWRSAQTPSLPPTRRETLCSSERLLSFYHHSKDPTAATNSTPQIIQTATKQGHQTSASLCA